jgi:hypothetical protein
MPEGSADLAEAAAVDEAARAAEVQPAAVVAVEFRAFLRDVPRAAAPIRRMHRTFRKDVP